ncbi:MAG: biotin/lipoyl-containing protein [Armatimonadota bacterium]|nr:biotin/lipoyl-containing protein [Armatimonadota bacterium]MDR7518472.1 biotin/lipoyl-containing protein [Armatimonadota bacterium]MDR7551055.1 biotin/lipoyl-containing protein [Armatimonadota bacterium]
MTARGAGDPAVTFEVTAGGRRHGVEVVPSNSALTVTVGGQPTAVRLDPAAGSECWRLWVEGLAVPVRVREVAGGLLVTVGAARVPVSVRRALPIPIRRATAATSADCLEVRAPMPGLIVSLPVGAGEPVAEGGTVAVVEAMKMQMDVPSPVSGRIEEIRVRPGQEVAGGQVLAVIRPVRAGEDDTSVGGSGA